MPKARPFPFPDSEAGVFHVVSRIAGREFLLDEAGRDFLTKIVQAYSELLGVQVLTHCTMSNHFHLLLRVPHRPEMVDGGPSVEELLAKLEKAVGPEQMKLVRLQLENREQAGALENIETWRQRQISAMYSLQTKHVTWQTKHEIRQYARCCRTNPQEQPVGHRKTARQAEP